MGCASSKYTPQDNNKDDLPKLQDYFRNPENVDLSFYDLCPTLEQSAIAEADGVFPDDTEMHKLSSLLVQYGAQIRTLNLEGCGICKRSTSPLSILLEWLKSSAKEICVLNLSSNDIADSGMTLLSDYLSDGAPCMKSVILSNNKISRQGVNHIEKFLKDRGNDQLTLDLSRNPLANPAEIRRSLSDAKGSDNDKWLTMGAE